MWTDSGAVMGYIGRESDPERLQAYVEFARANAVQPPAAIEFAVREAAQRCIDVQLPVATGLICYVHLSDGAPGMTVDARGISGEPETYTSVCSLPFSFGPDLDAAIVKGCLELHENADFGAGYPLRLLLAMPAASHAGGDPISRVEVFAVEASSGDVYSTRYDATEPNANLQFTLLTGHPAGELFRDALAAALGLWADDQRNFKEQTALFEQHLP